MGGGRKRKFEGGLSEQRQQLIDERTELFQKIIEEEIEFNEIDGETEDGINEKRNNSCRRSRKKARIEKIDLLLAQMQTNESIDNSNTSSVRNFKLINSQGQPYLTYQPAQKKLFEDPSSSSSHADPIISDPGLNETEFFGKYTDQQQSIPNYRLIKSDGKPYSTTISNAQIGRAVFPALDQMIQERPATTEPDDDDNFDENTKTQSNQDHDLSTEDNREQSMPKMMLQKILDEWKSMDDRLRRLYGCYYEILNRYKNLKRHKKESNVVDDEENLKIDLQLGGMVIELTSRKDEIGQLKEKLNMKRQEIKNIKKLVDYCTQLEDTIKERDQEMDQLRAIFNPIINGGDGNLVFGENSNKDDCLIQ